MKQKQLYTAMAILLATGGLVACGGGGDDTTDTTDISDPTTSSSKSFIGPITGFGSVFVNGIEFDTTNSTYDVNDDRAADQSDLRVGMQVRIDGSLNDDAITGTATSIYYDNDVEGPIDGGSLMNIDTATKAFTVLGLNVLVDANTTVFDDGASFESLAEGQVVEVSGLFDGAQIIASRIERQSDTDDEFEIKGTVASYDGNTISLTLVNGSTTNPYPVASTVESEIAAGSSGTFVEVTLMDSGSGLEATEIELDDDDLLEGDEEDVNIRGLVTGDYTAGFQIDGIPFQVNDGTLYEPTTLEGMLSDGMLAEVEGHMLDGVLIAEEIEAEHTGEEEVEIEARVASVEASDPTIGSINLDLGNGQSLSVQTDSSTLFEDDSDLDTNDDGSFTLAELISGEIVEVKAYLSDTGLIAAKVVRDDASDGLETTLQAPVESFEAFESITLLGITYTLSGTSYELDDEPTTAEIFFPNLDVGDQVEIVDLQPDGNAEEADLEN
jgi:hypothetical protein